MPDDETFRSHIRESGNAGLCCSCLGEYIKAENDIASGLTNADGTEIELPEINTAVTWAPAWQMQQFGAQMVVTCVSLPTCKRHIFNREETGQERASRSGLAVPQQMPRFN